MKLNTEKFLSELQKEQTDTYLAHKMGISRTQLWRAKKGNTIGQIFIIGLKKAFPEAKFEDYFFC